MGQSQSFHALGEYKQAELLAKKSKQALDSNGEQIFSLYNLCTLGRLAMIQGNYQKAKELHQHCLESRTNLGLRRDMSVSLRDLGEVAQHQGNYDEAGAYYQQSIAIAREVNAPRDIAQSLWRLGNMAVSMGEYDAAKAYFEESNRLTGRNYSPLGGPGWAELGLGNTGSARQHFHGGLERLIAMGKKPEGLDAVAGLAHLNAINGNTEYALELIILVLNHPATAQESKNRILLLKEELEAELSPELIAKAEARGRELDLFETAEALLADFYLVDETGHVIQKFIQSRLGG